MGRRVKISVIMGVCDPEKELLEKAVESVIRQTMQEWELLICDDGSGAAGMEMIREISRRDNRIILMRNEKNHGLAYALNRCLKRAKGRYIARMDDDDESVPERFRKQYEFLEENISYGWVGSDARLYDGKNIWGIQRMPEVPEKKDFLKYSPYIHPSVMFRREVLLDNHGYIPAEVTRRCEDYELFMRLHSRGLKGCNLREELLIYRETRDPVRKRRFQYRINEMRIRCRGFQRMGILKPGTAVYVIRPLAAAAVPGSFIRFMRRKENRITTKEDRRDDRQREENTGRRRV